MANNTVLNTGTGGDIVSDDQITSLNGGAIATGEKVQRMKLAYGAPASATDATLATPFPTTTPNASITGTFTAVDAVVAAPIGDGTLVTGTSTAGSIVALALPSNMSAWIIMLKVYTTGTVYSEASPNSTNGTDGDWVEIKGRKTGTAIGIESVGYAFTSAGIYRGNAASFTWFRLRYLGTFTAGMTALISLSHATGAVFLNSGLPAGNSLLGKVGIDQTTPGTTNLVASNTSTAITSVVTILQNATAATNNGTSLIVTGYGTAVIQITGTFVATINFEFSIDGGTTWNAISATQIGAGDIFQSTTIPGSFRITCTALDLIRARVTWTSGSVTINGRASNAINASKVVKLASGTNIVGKFGIDQTTPGTTNGVSVTSQPELVTTGTITTTDIVVAAPSGTGALLSGTSTAGSYVAMSASGGNASVVIGITGLTTGTIYYEGSADSTTGIDGNWIALNMKQAGVVNTQISSFATVNGLFRGNTAGIRYIRMRSVGTLTGTPSITLRLSAGVAGEFLFGSIPTGTNKIGSVDISAAVPLTTATAAALNADLIASIDVLAYKSVSIQLSGTWSGTISFQGCNDNVTFINVVAENISSTGSAMVTSTTLSNLMYIIPIKFRFLRVRMTSFSTGTATSTAIAYSDDRQVNISNVAISSGTSIGLNVSTTNIGGVLPRGTNVNGNTLSTLNSAATTNATLIKASAATVYTIKVMNASAANRFVRIYNLATAPTVGTSIPIMVVAIPATSSKELEFGMGIPFSVGLSFAITAGAAATDATVVAAGDVQLGISWN